MLVKQMPSVMVSPTAAKVFGDPRSQASPRELSFAFWALPGARVSMLASTLLPY